MLNIMIYTNLFGSIGFMIVRSRDKCPDEVDNKCKSVIHRESMSLVIILLSTLTGIFVTTLYAYHIYFTCRNMSTYSNLKMTEIFILFGNPFSKKRCKTNCYEALFRKYYKRVNFKTMTQNKEGIYVYSNSMSQMTIMKEAK